MAEDMKTEAPLEVDPVPEIVDDSAAKAEKRKADQRKRKAAQRARDKVKKQAKADKAFEASLETMSNSEWWALNIKKDGLTSKQIAEYEAREAVVLDLEIQMEDVIFQNLERLANADKYVDFSSPYRKLSEELCASDLWEPRELSVHDTEELKAKVRADVDKFGTRLSGIQGLNFASLRDCFDQWSQGDQSRTRAYAMYGFCLALESQLVIDFFTAAAPPGYGLRCQCGATTRVQDQSEVVPRWRCFKCAERDRKQAEVNAQLDKIRQQAIGEPDNVRPFDAFGRRLDE